MEKKIVRESLALRVKTVVPCAVTKSVEVKVAFMFTLPNGVMLPVPVTESVTTGEAPDVKLTFASDMAVIV
jgi:hypothetical protein